MKALRIAAAAQRKSVEREERRKRSRPVSVPKRYDLEDKLIKMGVGHEMYYGANAAYVTYSKARNHGLITDEQLHAARISYGNLWNYCGD